MCWGNGWPCVSIFVAHHHATTGKRIKQTRSELATCVSLALSTAWKQYLLSIQARVLHALREPFLSIDRSKASIHYLTCAPSRAYLSRTALRSKDRAPRHRHRCCACVSPPNSWNEANKDERRGSWEGHFIDGKTKVTSWYFASVLFMHIYYMIYITRLLSCRITTFFSTYSFSVIN